MLGEVERGLTMLSTDLRGGPFLLGRASPARADLTICSLFSQAGLGDAMPEVRRMVEETDGVKPYLQRVYDTVGGMKPNWLS